MLEVIHLMNDAWENITSICITNWFSKSGLGISQEGQISKGEKKNNLKNLEMNNEEFENYAFVDPVLSLPWYLSLRYCSEQCIFLMENYIHLAQTRSFFMIYFINSSCGHLFRWSSIDLLIGEGDRESEILHFNDTWLGRLRMITYLHDSFMSPAATGNGHCVVVVSPSS